MKFKISLAVLLSLLLLPAISFALTREEAIDETLNKIEIAQASKDIFAEEHTIPKNYFTDNVELTSEPGIDESQIRDLSVEPATDNLLDGKFYISADYDINHIHYVEVDDQDNVLDEDYGRQRGFYIAAGFKSNAYIKSLLARPYLEAYYRRFDDLITYDGAATNGVTTYPFMHDEKSVVEHFGVKLGGRRNITPKAELLGYLDVGHRNWYRGESETFTESYGAVASYKEIYRWFYLGLGMGIDYKFIPKISCGFEVEWMPAINPEMIADNWFLTVPETTTFKLESVYGVELKMPVKYYLLKNLSLDVTPYFTYWNIGKSDLVLTSDGYYYEPDSTTHIEGVLTGITYSF